MTAKAKKDTGDHVDPQAAEAPPVKGPHDDDAVVAAPWSTDDVDPLQFGRAAYNAYGTKKFHDDGVPFEKLDLIDAVAWVEAAAAAIHAYDAWLIKDANVKADAILSVQEAQEPAVDPVRRVVDWDPGLEAARRAAENPADTFLKAQAIEAEQATRDGQA